MCNRNSMVYDDCPITDSTSDRLGRSDFVRNIAEAITTYPNSDSFTIGLLGEWGSGKTSVLNLIEKEINDLNQNKKIKEKHIVIKFNPWNFTNQNQLLEQFFQFLKKELRIINYPECLYKYGKWCEFLSKLLSFTGLIIIIAVIVLCCLVCFIGNEYFNASRIWSYIFGILTIIISIFSRIKFVAESLSREIGDYAQRLKSFKEGKSIEEIKNSINLIIIYKNDSNYFNYARRTSGNRE